MRRRQGALLAKLKGSFLSSTCAGAHAAPQPSAAAGAAAACSSATCNAASTSAPALLAQQRTHLLASVPRPGWPRASSPPLHHHHHHHQQQQQHRGFIDMNQLKYDFSDPARSTTNTIMALNVAVYLATLLNPSLLSHMAQSSFALSQGQWWRLLTAPFCHSGLGHLGLNMLAVHWLAPPVEMTCGHTTTAVIYMAGALGGGLAHHLLSTSHSTVLGSSGAIAGLFAAFVVYKYRNRHYVGFSEQDRNWVLQMVAINVLLALMFSGSLAHMAHGGGAVGGALAMWFLGPRWVRHKGRMVDKPIVPLLKDMP